jgi:hypothetical protein
MVYVAVDISSYYCLYWNKRHFIVATQMLMELMKSNDCSTGHKQNVYLLISLGASVFLATAYDYTTIIITTTLLLTVAPAKGKRVQIMQPRMAIMSWSI